jgi:hypothetical protein
MTIRIRNSSTRPGIDLIIIIINNNNKQLINNKPASYYAKHPDKGQATTGAARALYSNLIAIF